MIDYTQDLQENTYGTLGYIYEHNPNQWAVILRFITHEDRIFFPKEDLPYYLEAIEYNEHAQELLAQTWNHDIWYARSGPLEGVTLRGFKASVNAYKRDEAKKTGRNLYDDEQKARNKARVEAELKAKKTKQSVTKN